MTILNLLVVFSADRGLCGSYNANLLRSAEALLRSTEGDDTSLFLLGRKARDYFKRRSYPVLEVRTELPAEARLDTARDLSERLQGLFLDGTVDAVDLTYTEFIATMSRRVVREPFLPIVAKRQEESAATHGYIFEPEAGQLLNQLLPRYATTKLLQALLESLASEHAARMVAMGSANQNAGEMIDKLVLKRNRIRQATITKELAEIVGGAAALD